MLDMIFKFEALFTERHTGRKVRRKVKRILDVVHLKNKILFGSSQ